MSIWQKVTAVSARFLGLYGPEEHRPNVGEVLAAAEKLIEDGHILQAISYATEQNSTLHDKMLEWKLIQWRHDAFSTLDKAGAKPDWPSRGDDLFPGISGIPEITADRLTPEQVTSALQHHGCLIVRGLLSFAETERFVQGTDRAIEGFTASRKGVPAEKTLPWYAETFPMVGDFTRQALYPCGVLTADSPRMFFELMELFHQKNVIDLVTAYLGEHPALSVKKSTLRKVPPTAGTSWHQDGAFLGADTRTINIWISLSDCGVDAPGLDIVAGRIPYIVETGTQGSYFDWDVSHETVKQIVAEGTPVVSPVFGPGDAVLFDNFLLHRTGVTSEMTRQRYAIESWFFAPSTYPLDRIPLVI